MSDLKLEHIFTKSLLLKIKMNENIIKDNIATLGINKTATLIGITHKTLRKFLKFGNIDNPLKIDKFWDSEKIQYLKQNYGKIDSLKIGQKIGIYSVIAIEDKAYELGLVNNGKINRWDTEKRVCKDCKIEYPKTEEFYKVEHCKNNTHFTSRCKKCDKIYNYKLQSDVPLFLKALLKRISFDKKRYSKGFDLDFDYLKDMYEKQDGKCKITNIKMTAIRGKGLFYSNLSIDRIDSKKGYTKGNVQLVCHWANVAKWNLNEDEFKIE